MHKKPGQLADFLSDIKKKFKKKKIELHAPYLDKDDQLALIRTIKQNEVSTYGKNTYKFEKKISKFVNSPYVLTTNTGTSAIHSILCNLKIGNKDEVLVQSMTFVATVNSILYTGASPHFVDIKKNNLSLDTKKLENYLENNFIIYKNKLKNSKTNKMVRALIITHLYGLSANMKEILKVCRKFKLILIEDAAEAFGSTYNNKHLGTFGICGALSFNGNKTITTGGGGAVICNNKNLYKKILDSITISKKKGDWRLSHTNIGYNYRMPSLNASLGLSQLKKIKKILIAKKNIYSFYKNISKKIQGIEILKDEYGTNWNCWLVVGFIKDNKIKRKEIYLLAKKYGIEIRPVWRLMHKLPFLKKYPRMDLSQSNEIENKIITFPSGPGLFL